MNSFIQSFRAQQPDYPGSDEDLVLQYGDTYPPDKYDYPPDFVADYQRIKSAQSVASSSVGAEFGQGVSRGLSGLKSTAAGIGALGADVVGADKIRNYLLDVYKRTGEETQREEPASVPKIEDIAGPSSAAQYVSGKLGELVPNLGEAAAFAVAGSAAAPGPGTEAGAAAGLFAKSAARSVLRKTIEKSLTPAIKKELEDYTAGRIAGKALSEGATKLVDEAASYIGGTAASAANFAGLGAGGQYGALANTEGVSDRAALEGAAIAGLGSSIGAVIPARVLKGLLPGLSEPAARSYVDLYAKKVPAEILAAGGGMGAMEFFNVLSEKHADPKKRDEDFTKEDWSRILNGIAVGVLASAPAVGVQAIRGVSKPASEVKTVDSIDNATLPPAPEPGVTPEEIVRSYPVQITAEQELVMRQIAERDAEGAITAADTSYLGTLGEPVKAKYENIKKEVSNAIDIRKREERVQGERQRADALVQSERQNRQQQTSQQKEGDTASVGDSLQQAASELSPENKAAVESVIGKPVEEIVTPKESNPQPTTSVPLMVTKEMEQGLADLGYSKAQRNKLKPEEAQSILKQSLRAAGPDKPEIAPLEVSIDTTWLTTVPETVSAWRIPRVGKAKESFFSDLDKDPKTNAKTKALGVFEAPDGSIVVATLYNNRGNKVALPGRERDYDAVVAKGYKPIGYVKTGERQQDFFRQYTKDQWNEVQAQLESKVGAAGKTVEPVAKATAAAEGLVEARAIKEPTGALSSEDAQRIAGLVDKEFGAPTADTARDNVSQALTTDPTILMRFREVAGIRSSDLINRIFEAYERVAVRSETEKLTPEQFRESVTAELTGLKPEAQPGVRLSIPAETSKATGTPELASIATHVTQRLQRVGIPVAQVQSGLQPLFGSIARSVGSFDRARQTVIWALSDLTAPTKTDIRVLFEEAAHALFDRESPEMREPILRAMGKLADASPDQASAVRRDMELAYPEGLPQGAIAQEELAMGYLSRKLVEEGFNPIQSRGIAQSILRLLKEVYLKAAMWLQRNFLGPEYANPEIAADYFRNRLQGFLAGDQETLSFIDRLGGPKATFNEQLNWSTPAAGESRDLVQIYNPVTGEIDTNPVLLDSVEAALLNLRGDDTRFSIPAPGAPPVQYVDPAIRLNRAAAVNNEVLDTRLRAAEAAGVDHNVLRVLNGLKDRVKIAEVITSEAQTKNTTGFVPTQRIEGFTQEANSGPSWRDSSKLLNDESAKIAKNLASDKEALPRLEARQQREVRDLDQQTDAYKDAGFMSALIKKGFKNLLVDDIRKDLRVSKTLGTIAQQFQELSGKAGQPIDRGTVSALRRLYTGDLLQGENLFNLLDQMANDPSLDFTRPASEIRQYIRTQAGSDPTLHRYNQLASNSPDARAMLATVIAYGKLHQRELAMLQMRRMASGEERSALEQQLRDLWKETREQIDQGIRQVAKGGGIQAVAAVEYRKALRRTASINRNVENLRQRVEVNEKALPAYDAALNRIAGKLSETVDTTFGDQMTVRVPKVTEEGTKWDNIKINLNSAAGPVTTSQEQIAIVNRLAEWTAGREEAAAHGDQTALGREYQDARRQLLEIVNNRFYEHALRSSDQFTTELILSSAAKQIESFGTPTSTLIGQKLRKFVSDGQVFRNQADREFGYKNPRLKQNLLGIVNHGRKRGDRVAPEWFTKFVLNPAFGFMEKMQPTEGISRETDVANAYVKLWQWLQSQPHISKVIGGNPERFMPALRELIDTRYQSGQFWMGKNIEAGLLVEDPKLEGKLRNPFSVGLLTFQRKFSDTFSNMVHALRNSGWGVAREELSRVGDLLSAGKTQEADALISKYVDHAQHGDTVKSDFIYQLFHTPDESIFETPALDESGTTHSADPMVAARAYDQAQGSVRQTFELMFDYLGGHGSSAQYVRDSLLSLVDQFEAANSALKKIEPRQASEIKTFTGLIPNAMIDARQFSHWPSEWFGYHEFDRNDNARMAERISGQINFGRDTRVLGNLHQTLKDETDTYSAKLKTILGEASRDVPSGKAKAIDAAAEKILDRDKSPALSQFRTGKARLEYLRRISQRKPFVDQFLSQMSDFYNRKNQAEGSLRWGVRFAQELSHLMVNNPGSAISQLSTMFDIPLQWGASPSMLKATARTVQLTAKDIAGSLAQGLGWKFLPLSEYEQRYAQGFQDPEVARRFGDFTATLEGEATNPAARAFRQLKDAQSFTANRLGSTANYTPARPLAPFFQFVMTANRALTISTWELADRYVRKAVNYVKDHPGTDRITPEMMSLRGLEKDSFERWRSSAENYGLRFEEMVSGAKDRLQNGDKTALTDRDLSRLYSVALNEVSLESNIATMPLAAFNNSLLRFITPLLGWSYRRTSQLLGKRLDTQDKNSLRAASKAMLGLAATSLGGLGISLVVDAYQEDLVGKKRNIRDLRIPQNLNDFIAIQERMARTGTLGLFGDLLNTAVNVGTGQGDNRILSVDQRVVALQSFQGLLSSISNLVNQDFDADYAHVVRPVFAALGGNGLLQYMQIANHAFDLDNVESRVVKRINASNYLRVVGRDQGLELRKTTGGYSTPTATTPWIARMEYAAYANDPEDFRSAYRGAVAEAKKVGKPDPADYVKKAFETRHPIRYVFAQVPSEREYRKVISAMDETGQDSVREAVRLFNYYGALVGLKPFEGSEKKDKQASAAGIAQARIRALTRATSFR